MKWIPFDFVTFILIHLFFKRGTIYCPAGQGDDEEGRAGRRVGAQIGRGNDQPGIAELKIYWGRCRRTLAHCASLAYSPHRTRRPHSLIVIESRRKARASVSDAKPFRDKSLPRKLLSIFTISENFLTRWQKYCGRTTDGKSILLHTVDAM